MWVYSMSGSCWAAHAITYLHKLQLPIGTRCQYGSFRRGWPWASPSLSLLGSCNGRSQHAWKVEMIPTTDRANLKNCDFQSSNPTMIQSKLMQMKAHVIMIMLSMIRTWTQTTIQVTQATINYLFLICMQSDSKCNTTPSSISFDSPTVKVRHKAIHDRLRFTLPRSQTSQFLFHRCYFVFSPHYFWRVRHVRRDQMSRLIHISMGILSCYYLVIQVS